jgi:hypothetical protein
VVSSKAAQETYGLYPKPWSKVIADLVMTYKADNQKETDK